MVGMMDMAVGVVWAVFGFHQDLKCTLLFLQGHVFLKHRRIRAKQGSLHSLNAWIAEKVRSPSAHQSLCGDMVGRGALLPTQLESAPIEDAVAEVVAPCGGGKVIEVMMVGDAAGETTLDECPIAIGINGGVWIAPWVWPTGWE
jgi:hypothetical protein